MEGEHPEAVEAAGLRLLGGDCLRRLRKPGEVGLVVDRHEEVVGGRKEVLVESDEEGGQLVVDLHQLGLLLRSEGRALLGKLAVVFLREALLHVGHPLTVAVVVDALDALEEELVEVELVVGLVEKRDGLLGHGGELIGAHRPVVGVEHRRHPLQDRRHVLQREDRVVEVGGRPVADYVVDVLLHLLDAGLDGRDEVGGLDLAEGRDLILCRVGLQKRIVLGLRHNRILGCPQQQYGRGGNDWFDVHVAVFRLLLFFMIRLFGFQPQR